MREADSLAQLVEHNTFNVGVSGSNPERVTKKRLPDVNCTPKVRQKTFGVQFVYEKDICRKT